MSAKDSIIDKISKLLRLASEDGGAGEHERSAAMARAQALMEKHRIEVAEVEATTGRDAEGVERFFVDVGGDPSVKRHRWKSSLFHGIAESNDVKMYRATTEKKVALVGRPSDVQYVRSLYAWLLPQLESEANAALHVAWTEDYLQQYLNTGARRDAWRVEFLMGAVAIVAQRLREARAAAYRGGSDLVVARGAANERHLQELGVSLKKGRRQTIKNAEAYGNGVEAGARADLRFDRRVGDHGGPRRLGA